MAATFTIVLFTLDRVRNVLLALAFVVLMKACWLMLAPALPGN